MMKNTKILFGLLVVLFAAANSCTKCPQCPAQDNIVIDNVDTARFAIVIDNVDTAYVSMPVPRGAKLDSLFRYSIVIDNVDTARYRIVTDDADAAKMIDIITKNKPKKANMPKQQKQ